MGHPDLKSLFRNPDQVALSARMRALRAAETEVGCAIVNAVQQMLGDTELRRVEAISVSLGLPLRLVIASRAG